MKSASRRHSGVDQSILARLDRHGSAPFWSASRTAVLAGAGVLVLSAIGALAWSARGQLGTPDPSALAASAHERPSFTLPAGSSEPHVGFELPPLVLLPETLPETAEPELATIHEPEPLPVARVPVVDTASVRRARRSRAAAKVEAPAQTQVPQIVDRDVAVLSAILSLSSRHGGKALPACVKEGPRTPCTEQASAQP